MPTLCSPNLSTSPPSSQHPLHQKILPAYSPISILNQSEWHMFMVYQRLFHNRGGVEGGVGWWWQLGGRIIVSSCLNTIGDVNPYIYICLISESMSVKTATNILSIKATKQLVKTSWVSLIGTLKVNWKLAESDSRGSLLKNNGAIRVKPASSAVF